MSITPKVVNLLTLSRSMFTFASYLTNQLVGLRSIINTKNIVKVNEKTVSANPVGLKCETRYNCFYQ
jgi:hypothetical protein